MSASSSSRAVSSSDSRYVVPYALDEAEQDKLWAAAKEATGAAFPWEGSPGPNPAGV